MNEGNDDILLLAGDDVAGEISAISGRQLPHCNEPYDALEELAKWRYRTVIVCEDFPDFPALVRAVRRLQGSARILGLCSPGGEADLQARAFGQNGSAGAADELDDYFIYPPSRRELESVFTRTGLREAPASESGHPASVGEGADLTAGDPRSDTPQLIRPAGGGERAGLTTEEVAEFVEAASSLETLAQHVVRKVGQWTGRTARWADAARADEDREPMLLLDDDPPRVLLIEESASIDPSAREKLLALQVLLGPIAAQARRADSLHRLAITDHLTGAYNRRYFYHFADQLLRRAGTDRFRVTLLLYDIDDFKRYNDTYGHAAGDEILRETAALMKRTTRQHDIVARIGGDEFAVLFWDDEPPRRPDSRHPETACVLAGRFIKALTKHEFRSLGREAKGSLTISGGLASFPWDGRTCPELLSRADTALRQAKASGKNAIHIIGEGIAASPGE